MMESERNIVQRWCAPNDTNGNPRRVFVVWSSEGALVDAIDEGYSGKPAQLEGLVDLGDVKVSSVSYREIIREAAL